MSAVDSVNGATFAGEFQEYITGTRRPQFPALLKDSAVCVALIDCDTDAEAALETMERLQLLLPQKVRLVGMSTGMDAGFLLRAMRAGCNEFLRKPLAGDELTSALKRFQATTIVDTPGTTQMGKAIAFMGTKGGVGTTTMAVHTAMHLVRTHKKKVLLIDQRQQLGHVALYLGIKQTKYHFSELLRNVDRLDAPLLEGLVTRHSVGLDVIASPDMCSPRYEPRAEDAIAVISFLRQRYDYVLVDTEPECTQWLSSLVTCCDEVAMVCTPDVAALRDLARHIEHLSLTDGFAEKLRVLVNRAGSEPAVSKDDIERAIRFPVALEVPNNYIELTKAINAGEPIPPTARGGFTQAIAKWSQSLARLTDGGFVQNPVKKKFSLWR
jgi:pilus assembly protein CpaE